MAKFQVEINEVKEGMGCGSLIFWGLVILFVLSLLGK